MPNLGSRLCFSSIPYLQQSLILPITLTCSHLPLIIIQLITGDLSLHLSRVNAPSLIFPNLSLHGVSWDEDTSQLCLLSEGEERETTKCSLLLHVTQTDTSSDSTGPASSPQTQTGDPGRMYDCPLLLLSSGDSLEASLKSSPVLCSVRLPCSCEWVEPVAMTTVACPTQTPIDCNYQSPSMFLSCEWPT